MEISTITIIISAVVLVLAVITPLFNPFFRLPKARRKDDVVDDSENEENNTSATTPLSIVIVAHDNAPELERHLPLYLSQKYEAGYEVIIVADKSDSETDDVIKRFASHKNLYATFMPLSSRYISRKKLAITLGIKAAHNEWVIITDAWCCPSSEYWLSSMSALCTKVNTMVLGYSQYDHDAPKHYHYEHLRTALYNIHAAQHSRAFGNNSPHIAIRKSVFMKEDGFLGNLKYMRGEYDFIANKFAEKEKTGVAVETDAILTEVTPIKKQWANKHLYAINTHVNMKGNTSMTLLYQFDMLSMHICNIAIICAAVYGILTNDYISIGAASLALIIQYFLRVLIADKALKMFETPVNAFAVPFFDYTQTIRNIGWRIKYLFADKYDFITHKI